jgi:DNA-binding transcriptional LysR family regulator
VRLTAAGAAFGESVRVPMSQVEGAKQPVRQAAAGAMGCPSIGFVGSVLFRGLPGWIAAQLAQHPRVEVWLNELNSQGQIDALMRDGLDIGFVHTRRLPDAPEPVHADAGARRRLPVLPAGRAPAGQGQGCRSLRCVANRSCCSRAAARRLITRASSRCAPNMASSRGCSTRGGTAGHHHPENR